MAVVMLSSDVPSVGDVVRLINDLYPPALALEWDAIGLVCGDPQAPVSSILLTVDVGEEVSAEAIDRGADLLIAHHPLFLSGVTSVAATDVKGRVVHRLIRHGVALLTAHTNADRAVNGVSDALAASLGVVNCRPLESVGERGEGLGRIGELPAPMLLTDFADVVARVLPFTRRGIHVAGDLMGSVQRIAVCGGSGDSLLTVADRAGADVLVTADLKHHRTLEHRQAGGCAVIDVPHWASEWPWLLSLQASLQSALRHLPGGDTVEIMVSEERTDPWTAHRVSE